jgi:hypothetical protein
MSGNKGISAGESENRKAGKVGKDPVRNGLGIPFRENRK